MADRVEHAADLLIATLVKSYFEPTVRFSRTQLPDFGRRRAFAFSNRNAAPQSLDGVFGRHAFYFDPVDLGNLISGGGDHVGELAVIGKQQQTLGIEIKPPHRMQPAE